MTDAERLALYITARDAGMAFDIAADKLDAALDALDAATTAHETARTTALATADAYNIALNTPTESETTK